MTRIKPIIALQFPVQINCKTRNNEVILPKPKNVFGSAVSLATFVVNADVLLFMRNIKPGYICNKFYFPALPGSID